jgi:Rrf2 family protein
MFSQTVEYALRAIVCLAQNAEHSLTTQQVSAMTRVPGSYLSKVLQLLGRAGLIQATRGIGGGYTLRRPPAEISILEVVNAIDPIRRITRCPLNLSTHGTHLCPLHRRLDNALAAVQDVFEHTTIADVLAEPSRSTPLCEPRSVKIGIKSSK